MDVELTATVGDQEVRWTERRWLVRSLAYAQAQEAALERRLATATAALRELVARKQGKKQLFHAELMQAAAGHRDARRGGGLAELHGASADDDAAGAGLPGPPGAAGDGRVLRDRGAPGRGADRGEEAGDGLAGLRDERRGDDACRRWCGRTGASIGSRTTGRG